MQDDLKKNLLRFDVLNRDSVDFMLDRYNRVNRWVIADMIRRSAHHYPDKTALIFQDLALTYAQLEKECNRTANALISLGVEKYDRVAVLAHNTLHHVLIWFGCCKAGAVYLPVNYLLTGSEIQDCINHSESKVLVVEDALHMRVKDKIEGMSTVRSLIWSNQGLGQAAPDGSFLEFETWYRQFPDTEPATILRIEEPCQMIYTSGTEDNPKGVVINNQSLISEYMSCILDGGYETSDVNINALPIYHSVQRDMFLNPVFYIGGTNILMGADIAGVLKNIETYRATMLFASPTAWIGILRHPDLETYDLSSLKKLYCGISVMPAEVLEALRKRFVGAKIFNFYGQTEVASYHAILKGEEAWEKPESAGRAGLNMEMRLASGDGQEEVDAGEQGEIYGRGPHTMMMYFKEPEKTDAVMNGGWFHSGDVGVLDEDGCATVVDRKKDVIHSDDGSVASRPIEEVIYLDARVEEVAVVGVPRPEGAEVPIAVVVPVKGQVIREEELFELCRKHLLAFEVPRKIIFVNALPKTNSGKLLKREIRKAYKDVLR